MVVKVTDGYVGLVADTEGYFALGPFASGEAAGWAEAGLDPACTVEGEVGVEVADSATLVFCFPDGERLVVYVVQDGLRTVLFVPGTWGEACDGSPVEVMRAALRLVRRLRQA